MKSFVFGLALFMSPLAFAQSSDGATIKAHMGQMGILLDEIWSLSANKADFPAAADKTSELRGHLIQVIGLLPPKVAAMEASERRLRTIEFQQFAARVIYLTANLENAFLGAGTPTSETFDKDVENLLREISTAVGRAHGKFR